MTLRLPPALAALGLAVVLWIVPSVGTQGMGTIGQRFTHPDNVLIDAHADTDAERTAARLTLQTADAATETALGFEVRR